MKRLFEILKKSSLLLLVLFMYACSTTDDSDPGGVTELALADIVGRWGILTTTEDGGTPETLVPCDNTLEIQENGDFLVIEAADGEWVEGNASFNPADSILTLTINGQTETVKILSVSANGFVVQFNENDGGTVTVGTDAFVKLEDAACASVTSAELQQKWSVDQLERSAFEITEGDRGDLLGTELFEDIDYNKFTIEFKSDGSFVMVDLVLEYDYGIGTYRNLDDHNLILEFEDDGGNSDGSLLHLTARNGTGLSFIIVDEDENGAGEREQFVSKFDIIPNDDSEPTIAAEALEGKWSASSVTERAFLDDDLVGEEVNDMITHNRLTLEFFDDGGLQFINLVDEVGFSRGEYMLLDGSNILLNTGNDAGEGDDEFELFHVVAVSGDDLTVKSYEVGDHEGGSGGGEANDGHEQEYDKREFELTISKNSGDEPSINDDELLGSWTVTEVENLGDDGNDEGPVVDMVLEFVNDGTGEVTFGGQVVTTFDYEFIDDNNLKLIFADGDDGDGGGGEANDDHEGESDNYNIFHIISNSGGLLELILFEPARDEGDGQGDGGQGGEGDSGGATYRIVMQKQG